MSLQEEIQLRMFGEDVLGEESSGDIVKVRARLTRMSNVLSNMYSSFTRLYDDVIDAVKEDESRNDQQKKKDLDDIDAASRAATTSLSELQIEIKHILKQFDEVKFYVTTRRGSIENVW